MWALSQVTGISVADLAKQNHILNPDLIYAGEYLEGILSGRTTAIITPPALPLVPPTIEKEQKVTTKIEEVAEAILYSTEYQEDATLLEGETRILQTDTNGSRTNRYQVTFVDEVAVSRELMETIVTTPAVAEIIAVGTKKAPVTTTLTEETTEAILYETEYVEDAELLEGETRIVQAGVNGSQTHRYQVTLVDGVETNRELMETIVTTPAVTEVIALGTKKALVTTTLTEETTEAILYETEYAEDAELLEGETRIVQAGINGSTTYRYQIIMADGVETNRELLETIVTTPVVTQVIALGTKKAPVITTKVEEVAEAISYTTEYVDDAELLVGETRVIQAGVDGMRTHRYQVTLEDDVETNRELLETVETLEPTKEIIAVGTKQVKVIQQLAMISMPYETIVEYDANLLEGKTVVVQEGQMGSRAEYYEPELFILLKFS